MFLKQILQKETKVTENRGMAGSHEWHEFSRTGNPDLTRSIVVQLADVKAVRPPSGCRVTVEVHGLAAEGTHRSKTRAVK